jgi:hypothetical protein
VQEVFARRYRGPLASANGGYACGRLATYVDAPAVEVTLRLPPPLERPLDVRVNGDSAVLLDGEAVVAEARAATLDVEAPAPVPVGAAQAAGSQRPRLWEPEFRECYVCGERPERDGLEIYVGPVEGREPLHAAPWVVEESATEIVWAAIDCPGAYASGAEGRGTIVLGRMAARVARAPEVGETCVVAAWPLAEDGRKLFAGTALFAADGELLALAKQVWIEPRRAD